MKIEKTLNNVAIKTDRLIIRKTTIKDVDLLLKMDKQEITQLYLGGLKNKSHKDRIIFLEKKIQKNKNEKLGSLTVFLQNEVPIGFIEFKNINDYVVELSYIFDYEYCKKGYCTEACQKLIDISFNKLNITKISAKTFSNNYSSRRVLSKLGFKLKTNNNTSIDDSNMFLEYELIKN